ncbi:PcfJ domain-containing protein [Myxococcota bacterium]|nr:PcfJ domain-containing protein [Myxococcota bacterium]
MVRDLALHSVAVCNPTARRAALRFAAHVRLSLHQWFVNDATGRLLQLVDTCPGALIFAYGLMERPDTRDIGAALLNGVVAGHRVDRVLDAAIRGWAEAGAGRDAGWHMRAAWAFQGLERPDSPTGLAARAAQRLLIRRAGLRVPTTTLWQPPPLRLVPEDIPRAVRANAQWFRAIKAAPDFYGGGTVPLAKVDGHLLGVIDFVSRHPDLLFQPRRGGSDAVRQRARTLLNFARSNGRCLGRTTDPALVAREVRKWSRTVRQAGESPSAWVFDSATPLFHVLDTPYSDGALVARPLLTAADFEHEGRAMRNCVEDRLPRAASGRACYFHVDIDGRPVTLEVLRGHDRFVTGEVAGPENAAVSPGDAAEIERFVGQVLGGIPQGVAGT